MTKTAPPMHPNANSAWIIVLTMLILTICPLEAFAKSEDTLDAICNDTGDYADAFAHYCRFFEARDDYESKRKNVALLCLGDSPPTTCARIADCLADPYIDSFLCNDEALTLAELKPKRVEACKSATDPGVICAEQALVEVCNTTPFAWHCQPSNIPDYIAEEVADQNVVTRQADCLGFDDATNPRPSGITAEQCDEFILAGSTIHAIWANKALDPDGNPLGFLTTGTERIYENVTRTSDGNGNNVQPVILLDLSEPPSGTHENSDGYRIILEGDATDGFATYQADVVSAGILMSTDLGALFVKPADDSPPTVTTWYGRVGVRSGVVDYASNDFKLTIDFNAQTLESSTSLADKTLALFRAKFNEFGIIYGQVDFDGTRATLSGLIGEDGAIGTWATNQNDSTIRVFWRVCCQFRNLR